MFRKTPVVKGLKVMAVARHPIELRSVNDESSSISPVVRTIGLAFSDDPLIRWLRPHAAPWSTLSPEICSWQYRRIQQALFDGLVFSSGLSRELAERFPSRASTKSTLMITEQESSTHGNNPVQDAGTAILVFPPRRYFKWTIRRGFLACKLWLLNWLDPAPDSGACQNRVGKLLEAHDHSMDKMRARYGLGDVWYLEVLAVHPSLQSRGLGGKMMRWLLEYIDNDPIVLECTSPSNIKFYERWGFEVVEEVELRGEEGEGEESRVWVMLRLPQR